jgi:hypothetical protein
MNGGQGDQSWATRYRLAAVEARKRAAAMESEVTRQKLLKLAAEYDENATECERKIAAKDSI